MSREEYSKNCDYIRNKFNLKKDTSIYDMVNVATEYIKLNEINNKNQKEEVQSQKEKEQCQKKSLKQMQSKTQSKLKKLGRPKKLN